MLGRYSSESRLIRLGFGSDKIIVWWEIRVHVSRRRVWWDRNTKESQRRRLNVLICSLELIRAGTLNRFPVVINVIHFRSIFNRVCQILLGEAVDSSLERAIGNLLDNFRRNRWFFRYRFGRGAWRRMFLYVPHHFRGLHSHCRSWGCTGGCTR